jgi:16S rRNA processing protein RimM
MNSNIDESEKIIVAYVGKTIGLKGQLKLRPQTDFLDQFKEGVKLEAGDLTLEIESFDKARLLIKFVGYNTIDEARRLSTTPLSATIAQSRESCELEDNEYFWFDVIGSIVIENDETLGAVDDIERFPGGDYLSVITDEALIAQQFPKTFLIPYNDRYIVSFDAKTKTITTKGSKDILEAS